MESERLLWDQNIHYCTGTFIVGAELSVWNPDFFVEPEMSLWKSNVQFGTRTFIVEPEHSLWKQNFHCGNRTFILET
jgi:hypothetical protein